MLIVEELHLLLLRPDGRTESAVGASRLFGEIAAVIVDLALHGRVVVTADRKPVVQVLSTEPTGHPILDAALARIAPLSGRRLDALVARSKLDPLEEVVASLVAQGVIVRGERGFLGMGAQRTPETDAAPEAALRARLAGVLAGSIPPSQADLTLLAILQAQNAAHAILRAETSGASARDLKKRIEQLTAGSPAGDAVAAAVAAVVTALMTATLTPVIVAATVT